MTPCERSWPSRPWALTVGPAFAAGADKDGDGKITRAELTEVHATPVRAVRPQQGRRRRRQSEGDSHFLDLADFNRDGKVTREENEIYASEAAARRSRQLRRERRRRAVGRRDHLHHLVRQFRMIRAFA